MTSLRRQKPLVTLLLAGALACGGDSPVDPGTDQGNKPDVIPASLSVAAGGGETVRVGLPVATAPAVTVRNAAGNPLTGVGVTLAVEAGGGQRNG